MILFVYHKYEGKRKCWILRLLDLGVFYYQGPIVFTLLYEIQLKHRNMLRLIITFCTLLVGNSFIICDAE